MPSERLKNWLILVLLALIWGSSFILMKRAMFSPTGDTLLSAYQVGALRVIIAGVVLLPISLRNLNSLRQGAWVYLLVVGLCGNALPALLFATAQTAIPSSLAGMLNALTPLFTLLVGVTVFNSTVRWQQLVGIVIGLAGAVLLVYNPGGTQIDAGKLPYTLLVVAATLCYAISLNVIKHKLAALESVRITALALLVVLPVGLVVLLVSGQDGAVLNSGYAGRAFLAVTTLAVLGTAVALIFFNMLVKRVSSLFASSVTYLIPVVAIFWGLYDSEPVAATQILGMGIVISGIILINTQKAKR